jgi:peptide/nickel transport system substrate-binding protein
VFKLITTLFLALVGLASLISACNSQPIPPTVNPAPVSTEVTPNPDGGDNPHPLDPTPTETVVERQLVICTGPEPSSLFPYGSLSASARSILQAIYDGPIEYNGFTLAPVIVEQIPSLENGQAFFETLQVMPGDNLVDNNGEIGSLREGTVYRPSGCRSAECAVIFSGAGPVQIDSLVVRFRLLPGLKWSDGSPLTARDSEYAYQVAQAVYPAYRPELVRLTHSYRSTDETTVEWRGLPGSQIPRYSETFFSPLPGHAWKGIPASELASSQAPGLNPLGWGSYRLDEWDSGVSVSLVKNPQYFRSDQELPHFDRLIFKFSVRSEEAIQALLLGECDLADEVALGDLSPSELQELQSKTGVAVYTEPGGGWEQILFGIAPLSEDRPAFFRSPQVRQAIAMCIDRERIINDLYPGLTIIPDSLLLPAHPLYTPEVVHYSYNPQATWELLTASGWVDHDNDPDTPRLAQGVAGIQDGTPFEFTYLASNEEERQTSAGMIVAQLADCGIRANLSIQDSSLLYASGPDGPVFGRQFDAVQLAWLTSSELPCSLYSSNEIPAPYPDSPKGWGGANATGFSDEEFDRACRTSLSTMASEPAYIDASQQVQRIFSEQVPALPLYLHVRVVAARSDLCGIQLDPSNANSLWNLEELDYGETCQP